MLNEEMYSQNRQSLFSSYLFSECKYVKGSHIDSLKLFFQFTIFGEKSPDC